MKRVTSWYSNKVKGTIPKGCQLCSLGSKVVLFITGTCDSNCFYCPLSKEKRNDIIFANEKQIHSISEAFEEAEMISALGAGITGGDPSSNIDRTVEYISKLKEKFGKAFHCHLYTSYSLNQTDLKTLHSSGLDEIRFHPPRLQLNEEMKNSITIAKTFSWDVGFEIPVIPDKEKEIQTIIDFAESTKLDFVNLNELEITEENLLIMNKLGFHTKTDVSAAVKGSEELALAILKNNTSKTVTLHYCSSSYKDRIQLRNRLKRRAKNFAIPSDEITEDGLLVRARIIIRDSEGLTKVANMLIKNFGVPEELVEIDEEKVMIYTNWKVAQKYSDDMVNKFRGEIIAIQVIHQYPHENGIITYLDPIFEKK
ncbi:MAG: radical SAM protein [Candidatus Heimdallarchaeota archaeon]|nr:radical SAM protein [Candidatus Heimdallarchaeota archaeon]